MHEDFFERFLSERTRVRKRGNVEKEREHWTLKTHPCIRFHPVLTSSTRLQHGQEWETCYNRLRHGRRTKNSSGLRGVSPLEEIVIFKRQMKRAKQNQQSAEDMSARMQESEARRHRLRAQTRKVYGRWWLANEYIESPDIRHSDVHPGLLQFKSPQRLAPPVTLAPEQQEQKAKRYRPKKMLFGIDSQKPTIGEMQRALKTKGVRFSYGRETRKMRSEKARAYYKRRCDEALIEMQPFGHKKLKRSN